MSFDILSITANEPKASFEDYIFTIYGRPKVGKTTFAFNVCKEHYKNGNASFFMAFEDGVQALKGVFHRKINTWAEYKDTNSQLIDNKDKVPYKVVVHDTIDAMYDKALKFVLRRESLKDSKVYKVVNDIPWGKGYDLVNAEIDEQVVRLRNAGFGLIFIGHNKSETITTRDGVEYNQTTLALNKKVRDLFVNMSDFILFVENDKEKIGETVENRRWIYLRSDGGDIEAGSRFKNIRSRVDYDVKEFLEAFREAVEDAHGEDVDVEEVAKRQSKERQDKAKDFADVDKESRVEVTPETVIKEIDELVKTFDAKKKTQMADAIRPILGTANYKKSGLDLSKLVAALEATKSI